MPRSRALLFAFLLVACVGCDQAAKHVAERALLHAGEISLAGDALRFELAHNPGAFMGLGSGLPAPWRGLLLGALAPLALGVACFALLRSGPLHGARLLGLALVVGGGIGNWLDRVVQDGLVTDFVSLGAGPLRTGIFNLADLHILAGIALLLAAQPRREPPAS
jgi:signal peptidase II